MPRTWSGSPSRKRTTGATDEIGRHEISKAVAKQVAPIASSNPSADASFTTRSKIQRGLSAMDSSCIATGAPKDSSAQSHWPRKPLRDRGNIDKAAPACTPPAVSPSTKHRNPLHNSRPRLPYRAPGPQAAAKERLRVKNTVSGVRQRRFATKSKNDHAPSSGTDFSETSEVHTAAGPESVSREDELGVFAKSPRILRTPPKVSKAREPMLADEVSSAGNPGAASARTPKIPRMPPEASCPGEPLGTHDETTRKQGLAAFAKSPRVPRTPPKEARPGELGNARGDPLTEGDLTAFASSPRIPRTPPEASSPGELVIVKIGSTRRKESAAFARSPRIPPTPPDISYHGELQSAAGRASIPEKGGSSAGSPGPVRTPSRGARPAGARCTTASLSTEEELAAFARTPKIPRTPPIAHRPAQTTDTNTNTNGGSSSECKEETSARHSRTGDVPRSPPATLAPGVIIDVTGTPVVESGGLATAAAADPRRGESSKAMATGLPESVPGPLAADKLSPVETEACPDDESYSLSAMGEAGNLGPEAAEDAPPKAIVDDSAADAAPAAAAAAAAAGTLKDASSTHGTLERVEQEEQIAPRAIVDLLDAAARPTASCSRETGGEADATGEDIDGVEPSTSGGTRALGPKGTKGGRGIDSLAMLVSRDAAGGGGDGDAGGVQRGRKARHGLNSAPPPAGAQDDGPQGEGSEEAPCSAFPAKESEPPVPRPKPSIPPPAPISTSTRNRLTLEEVRPRICVGRYVSPVPTNPSASGRETRAGEHTAPGQRLDVGGIERKLTPAAFENLASEMRTPGTAGAGRAGDSLDKARSMGSLNGTGWLDVSAKGSTPGAILQRASGSFLTSGRDGGAQAMRTRPSLPSSSSASAAATFAAASWKGEHRASFPREAPRADIPGSGGDREVEDPEVRCTEASASVEARKESSVDNADVASSGAHGSHLEGAGLCTSAGCSLPMTQASGGKRGSGGGLEGPAEVASAVSAASEVGTGADDIEVLKSGGVHTEGKQAGATEDDEAEPKTGSKLKGSSEVSVDRSAASGVSSAGMSTTTGVIPGQGIDAASLVFSSLSGVAVNKGTANGEVEEAAGADQVASVAGQGSRASADEEDINPFARKCELPRTPVGQTQADAADVVSPGGARSSQTEKGDKGEHTELRDLREANVQIGELHREVASMADRLTKQTEERERIAQVALRAQDEVSSLRQVMDGLQRGSSEAAPSEARGAQSGSTNTTRVLELELQKWEMEQDRQAAQLEAKETKRELAEARAKVKELAMRDEARKGEWLEEQLRRAQERCAEDEKMMEERRIKAKLLAAEIKAEMMRNRLVEDERERAERNVRVAAVTIARRAANLVEELCSRNERLARREAGLREGVEECEERVALLTEHSGLLEQAGRTANHEVAATRRELEETREALVSERVGADGISASLEALEREYRNAQRAQDELRVLANVEEARRLSVERRMSEVRRGGETAAGIERARRESTERRLGLAERSRDELAAAAAAAAGPAFRAAAEAERGRRVSLERRLDAAERARAELTAATVSTAEAKAASAVSVAESELRAQVEAERRQRLLLERRLEILESERTELAKAATTAAEAAIKAAENVSAASARVGTTHFISPGTKEGKDIAPLVISSQPTSLVRSAGDVPAGRESVAGRLHGDRKTPDATSGSAAAAAPVAPPAAEDDSNHGNAGCLKDSATCADGAPDFDVNLESSESEPPEVGNGMDSTRSDAHLGGDDTRHSKEGEVLATDFPRTVRRGGGDDDGRVVPRRPTKRLRSAGEPSSKLPRGSSDGQPGERRESNKKRSACLETRATSAAAGEALPPSPPSPGSPPAHEDGGRTGRGEPKSTGSTNTSEERAMCDSGRDGVGTEESGISAKLNDAALDGGHGDAGKSPSESVRGEPGAPKLYGRRLAGCSPAPLGELGAEVEKVDRRKRSARVKRDSDAMGSHAGSSSSAPQVDGKKPGRRGSAAASRRRGGKVHQGAEEDDVAGVSGKPDPPKVVAGNVVGWETLRAVPTRQSRARKEVDGGGDSDRSSPLATSVARTSADSRTASVSPSVTEVDSGASLKKKNARTGGGKETVRDIEVDPEDKESGGDIPEEESRVTLEPRRSDEGASKDKGKLSPASTRVGAAAKKGGRARRAGSGGGGGHHAADADGAAAAVPEADLSARGSSSSRVSGGRSKRRQTTQPTGDGGDDDECGSGNGSPVLVDSPTVPPPKRSRRLLGVGGARCKTPRAGSKKITVADAGADTEADTGSGSSDPVSVDPAGGAIQDAQRESVGRDDGGESAACVEGSTVVTERVSREMSVQDGVKGPSSPGGSGEVRGTPSEETGGGADSTGGASGDTQSEPGVARPRMDATKRQSMASSVLGLRRSKKTKFGVTRESFFQGFLDPKNGFKAPKLKAGAKRS